MKRILVTGALGQIGTELDTALRNRHGVDRVVASDIKMMPRETLRDSGPFEYVDCTNARQIQEVILKHDVGTIYHLAALLSAVAEEKPH
ncbi:MAG: NAD-dependent epimerase/dehydratase family protein, partial [Acidobacteriota bacterium]